MPRRQSNDLIAPAIEKRIGCDVERTGAPLDQGSNAASNSRSLLTLTTKMSCPTLRAASCTSLT